MGPDGGRMQAKVFGNLGDTEWLGARPQQLEHGDAARAGQHLVMTGVRRVDSPHRRSAACHACELVHVTYFTVLQRKNKVLAGPRHPSGEMCHSLESGVYTVAVLKTSLAGQSCTNDG